MVDRPGLSGPAGHRLWVDNRFGSKYDICDPVGLAFPAESRYSTSHHRGNCCAAVEPMPACRTGADARSSDFLEPQPCDRRSRGRLQVRRPRRDRHQPPEHRGHLRFCIAAEIRRRLRRFVDGDGNLVRLTYSSSRKLTVARCVSLFDWSLDGTALAYLSQTDSGSELRLLRGGVDRSLGPIPDTGVGGCESIAGCAIANSVDYRLSYSPDGAFISLVLGGIGTSVFRIWSSDGKPLEGSNSQRATMSAWSGSGLYFRDAQGVAVWRAGTTAIFLPGVVWIRPDASPAGGQIVYVSRDGDGWAHTLVVDTTTRVVRELKAHRSEPVFLTSRYIWYQGERDCVPADGCGTNPPFHPASGKTYIYDLQDGTETGSVITSVADVWPHAA